MGLKEIEIVIDKTGEVKIHVKGLKGDACLEFSKWLEQALGNQVLQRQFSEEYYEPNTTLTTPSVQQKQG